MKTKNISIIIPAYNEEERIEACLEALTAQLKLADEVVLVDNNSTDKTVSLAKQYKQVRILKEKKQGQVFAQAKGFDAAKNRVLARIDADSVVTDGWLEHVRNHFSESSSTITGPGVSYDLAFNLIPSLIMGFWTFTTNKIISGHYPVWGSNFVFTKKTWQQVKPNLRFRQDIWEDFEMGVELHNLGHAVKYDKKLIVGYSNKNGAFSSLPKAIAYQLRAPKTYWVAGSKFAAVFSFVERNIMMLSVFPLYVIEFIARSATSSQLFGMLTKDRRLSFSQR